MDDWGVIKRIGVFYLEGACSLVGVRREKGRKTSFQINSIKGPRIIESLVSQSYGSELNPRRFFILLFFYFQEKNIIKCNNNNNNKS